LVTTRRQSNKIKSWRFKRRFGLHCGIRSISACGLLW
jgi:hypothetical protein